MAATQPTAELDSRFSAPDAQPTPWSAGRKVVESAPLFWITTVRADGRPHVTPLIAVWVEEALFFCTGPEEQKARNLRHNRGCILTTGCNSMDEGLDVVVEGEAAQVSDEAKLGRIAAAYVAKYGEDWRFAVEAGAFAHDGGTALVFELAPVKAFGFRKGTFSQTRWRFGA